MERRSTAWISVISGVAFASAVWLAVTRPATLAEATLWNDLVRPPLRQAFFAQDAWSGWIYAVLAKRAAGLFRLSEFSMRLPALAAGGLYLWILPRRPALLLAAIVPVALGWFSTASGVGLALGFCAAAWRWHRAAPVLLGVAVATCPVLAAPLGLLAVAWAVRSGRDTVERIAIPAITTAFILSILPLSHAAAPSPPAVGSREERAVRDAVQPLRGRAARIATNPELTPLVEFYKARYRQRTWEITDQNPQVRIGF